ncbi:MAG: SDR family NAD(P)-dependent oxidoreductase [Rhodovibrionaceae bacterium]
MSGDSLPQNDVVWITGASSGLGRALALRFARAGAAVAASARDAAALQALSNEAENLRGSIAALPLDVTDEAAFASAAEEIERELGPIATLVLNAGTHRPVDARALHAEDFRKLLEVNVMGVVNGLAAALPAMRERGRGRIAVVASLSGYRGLPSASAYGLTKAGLINLCEALRPELALDGVILQLVNPGFVKTPLTDKNTFRMPFLMELEDAAEAFYRGLHSSRFEIVFPRRFAYILKIMRCLPYALYFRLTRRMARSIRERDT